MGKGVLLFFVCVKNIGKYRVIIRRYDPCSILTFGMLVGRELAVGLIALFRVARLTFLGRAAVIAHLRQLLLITVVYP